jgi:hypothetical protein
MTKPYAGSDTMSPPVERRGTDHQPVLENAMDDQKLLDFASTSVSEQEVVIRLSRVTGLAHISCCWPTWTGRFFKRYGRPQRVSVSKENGRATCTFWDIPIRYLTFRRPQPLGRGNLDALKRGQKGRQKG